MRDTHLLLATLSYGTSPIVVHGVVGDCARFHTHAPSRGVAEEVDAENELDDDHTTQTASLASIGRTIINQDVPNPHDHTER